MKWGKFNAENGKIYEITIKRMYQIGGICIKLSEGFVKFIEKTIDHIKKNKKIYMRFVKYIAFCLMLGVMPDIIDIVISFDYVGFIQYMKSIPVKILIMNTLYIIKTIVMYGAIILTSKDILKSLINTN